MLTHTKHELVYGYILLVICSISWATSTILIQLCYDSGFGVVALLCLRYALSLPVFILLVKFYGEPLLPPKDKLKPLLLLAANVLAWITLLYLALYLLPVTLAILFYFAYPTFTSLVHILLGRGSLGIPRLLALVISAMGLILLYWSSAAGLSVLGVVCALLAALLHAVRLFQTASLLPHISAAGMNLFHTFTTTVTVGMFYVLMGAFGEGGFGLSAVSGMGWVYLLLLGVLITVVANMTMTLGVRYLGAVDTSLVTLLEPIATAALAFLVFGDMLSPWQMWGGLLILLAVVLPAIRNRNKADQA